MTSEVRFFIVAIYQVLICAKHHVRPSEIKRERSIGSVFCLLEQKKELQDAGLSR
jgi:hypothetical protein